VQPEEDEAAFEPASVVVAVAEDIGDVAGACDEVPGVVVTFIMR
jgi:hypothetical protein